MKPGVGAALGVQAGVIALFLAVWLQGGVEKPLLGNLEEGSVVWGEFGGELADAVLLGVIDVSVEEMDGGAIAIAGFGEVEHQGGGWRPGLVSEKASRDVDGDARAVGMDGDGDGAFGVEGSDVGVGAFGPPSLYGCEGEGSGVGGCGEVKSQYQDVECFGHEILSVVSRVVSEN